MTGDRFLKKLFFFSIFLVAVLAIANYYLPEQYAVFDAYYAVAYFYLSTLLVHRMLIKATVGSPQQFIRTYLTSTIVRMFVGLFVLVIYMLVFKEKAMKFALIFLLLYFVYLIFEVMLLLKYFRNPPAEKTL